MPEAEEQNQKQNPELRRPPRAGGPRRREQVERPAPRQGRRKSRLKKALPYLVPGIATGGGIAVSLSDLFSV